MRISTLYKEKITEGLTSSVAVFPVNPSAWPAVAGERKTHVGSGPSSVELSERPDPVGASLKMCLVSELNMLTKCSLIWKNKGTPLGRWWWVLSTPEPRTDGNGFGLLQTPSTGGMDGGSNSRKAAKKRGNYVGQLLRTPLQSDAEKQGHGNLSRQVKSDSDDEKGERGELTAALRGTKRYKRNGSGTGRLSPCFVEWMMGYPAGYTDVSD